MNQPRKYKSGETVRILDDSFYSNTRNAGEDPSTRGVVAIQQLFEHGYDVTVLDGFSKGLTLFYLHDELER